MVERSGANKCSREMVTNGRHIRGIKISGGFGRDTCCLLCSRRLSVGTWGSSATLSFESIKHLHGEHNKAYLCALHSLTLMPIRLQILQAMYRTCEVESDASFLPVVAGFFLESSSDELSRAWGVLCCLCPSSCSV